VSALNRPRSGTAVRYAADDDCPVGCVHPEPAVLVRRHWSGLLKCCVPAAGGATHLELGSDVPAEQRLQGFERLRCRGRVVLIAAASPRQQKGADVWFEPT
jgi:hypothetical protein